MFSQNNIKSLFLACKHISSVAKIHALLITSGYINRGSSNTQLIASYARTGDIKFARKVFDKTPKRGVDAWNAIIVGCSRQDCPGEVIDLYREMNVEGVRPDSSIFTVTIKACTSIMNWEMGEEIRTRAIDSGYEHDVYVISSMLNLYAKCGRMDEAMRMFEKMPRRDAVSWTTMVTGFAQCGRASEAINVYRLMQREGMDADRVVMLGLIQACAIAKHIKIGLSIHGYLIRRHISMDMAVQSSLVDMYAKNGNLDLASRVFDLMPRKNVVAWNALISGHVQNGFADKAFELLRRMQSSGFNPDMASIVGVLLACSQTGSLKLGRSLHGYVTKRLYFDQVLATALIDMYSKCGSLLYARKLFDKIIFKDLILWNTMIASYGIHGQGKEALSVFLKMLETNSKPDHATFASLLSALSHAGLVEEGRSWFHRMVNEFKIEPTEKHYACMADILARGGQVDEAYNLIHSMKTKPGLTFWVALLSGCHNHGKFSIGEIATKKILEFDPDHNTGIYALVSNFYAKARKWDKVAEMRDAMRQSGIKKVPGSSVVEVNGKLHAFLMEDKSHLQYQEILEILEILGLEMTYTEDWM